MLVILNIYRHLYWYHKFLKRTIHLRILFYTWDFSGVLSFQDSIFHLREHVHCLGSQGRKNFPWQPGSTGKNNQDVTWCHKLLTMFSATWTCQLLSQQRKLSVMERTLNLESEHLSVSLCLLLLSLRPWTSHSTSQGLNFLSTNCPTYPPQEASLEHWCLGYHLKG